jgi:hypothetical protein
MGILQSIKGALEDIASIFVGEAQDDYDPIMEDKVITRKGISIANGEYRARYRGKKSWLLKKGEDFTITVTNLFDHRIDVFVHTTYHGSGEGKRYKNYQEFKHDWSNLVLKK